MSEPSVLEILQGIRFLEGVPPGDLQRLAAVAELKRYAPNATVFREGDKISSIFLVAEGAVGLELLVPGQGAKRIHTVGTGELLGWSPVLGKMPMTATARALAPTLVAILDAGQVTALCHHDPMFGFIFMRQIALALAQRLNATRLQLLDVYHSEIPAIPNL